MSNLLNRKLLLSCAAAVLVIAGVTGFILNKNYGRSTTSRRVTNPLLRTKGNQTSAKLSSAGTSPVASMAPMKFEALGHDWRITASGGLYISTNSVTYYQVHPPKLVASSASGATVVVTGSTVMVYPMPPQYQVNPRVIVDVTHDGGLTWRVVQLPAAFGPVPASGQFVVSHGSVVGLLVNNETMPDFMSGEWYQTTNDGDSWTEYHTPQNTGGSQIRQVGSGLWLLAGPAQQQLDESTNGGVSWSPVHFPGESLDSKTGSGCLYQVYPSIVGEFPSGETVLLTGKGPDGNCTGNMPTTVAAYESANNGVTWQPIASNTGLGGGIEGPTSLALVQGNSIWVAPGLSGQPRLLHITATGSLSFTSPPAAPSLPSDSYVVDLYTNATGQLELTMGTQLPGPQPIPLTVTNSFVSRNQGGTWNSVPIQYLPSGAPIPKQP